MPKKKPYFKEKRIKEIVQKLKAKVAEHFRKQNEGILPYYSRMPVTIIEIRHVMLVLDRTRSTAQKVMKDVREQLGKKPRQKVTVTEFCDKTGIPVYDVRQALNLLT